jgi:hypothetical protein
LYQDNVIKVTGLTYNLDTGNNDVVTFNMTKAGVNFDCTKVQNLNIYFAPYDNTLRRFQFDPPAARLAIKGGVKVDNVVTGSLTGDAATGLCTSTFPSQLDNVSLATEDGVIVVYGYDEQVGSVPGSRVRQVKYPYAALLNTTANVDYVSAANVEGCEKCHTVPYLKHGNIYGRVAGDPATDFITCKACHLDNGDGGHFIWQLLVDDTERAAELWAQAKASGDDPEDFMDNTEKAKYAYKTRLINDVHMSHAMEFPYPQSMSNCATCHEGKLDVVLSDANFKIETCKSCHPVTGAVGPVKEGEEEPSYDTTKLALNTILPAEIHGAMDLNTEDCTACHGQDKMAKPFNQIHTGYDTVIYTADGLKYSDAISVTIDSASFDGSMLNFTFSAHESPDIEGLDAASIAPTVLVGLYGWDTKDYIIGPHERLTDDNADGKIDSDDERALEYGVGEEHPRFTTVSAEGGSWEVSADLSTWADLIADGTVKRVEIGVMPALPMTSMPPSSRWWMAATPAMTRLPRPSTRRIAAGMS